MSENVLCSCSHVSLKAEKETVLEDFSLSVREKELIALISEDDSAGAVLRLMAGLYVPDQGKMVYSDMVKRDRKVFPKKIQYVPDDIVCYAGLSVREFLKGMAGRDEQMASEAARLLAVFGIDENEALLEMTFGQNRLVSIIQAMMAKPALLLMDRPYDMLGDKEYKLLLKEMIGQYYEGTAMVIAAERFEDVVMPCHQYLFMNEGKVTARYNRSRLPRLSKVVTMWGGDASAFQQEKMEVLVRRKQYVRFLYREQNVKDLAAQLVRSGCENFNIEELSMEEEIFHNYERWL